ncbi:MAG: hypothetical protein HFI29_09900 [Lachnospiraceae bacterium]|jgi:hypothetical protein|nr:hypothetical protein [Lachnospiraceae bacterium]
MKKAWDVTVNGVVHKVEYKTSFGTKILVNGNVYKTRSQNWFINMIDYPITIDGAEIRVVAIGNKVDLAVNGRYLGSGEEYVPLNKVPVLANVFVGISCIGGFLTTKWLGFLIGVLFSFLYIKQGLKGKTGAMVVSFIICTAIQIVLMIAVSAMLLATGMY